MVKRFEVRWEGEVPAAPQDVWDAITKHADGYLWTIEYEPWLGGAERGLTTGGGTVTAWEPARHFATRTRLEPAGLEPIDGVVDYATGTFLGVRSADALYRLYGRDTWGWPAGVAHHLFAGDVDQAASERAWGDWVAGVFESERVG